MMAKIHTPRDDWFADTCPRDTVERGYAMQSRIMVVRKIEAE